jgi:arabinose-5-phosphate isomerase
MTRNPLTVTPDTLASSALRLMNERKISQFLVVDTQDTARPVGVIHLHDFLKAGVA